MPSNITLKANGLRLQENQLEVQPGGLTTASNVIIRRSDVLEPRRGYKLYGSSFGTSSDTAKQILTYKNRIIRHYSNQLQYDTGVTDTSGTEVFNTFSGTYLEPQTGRKIRSIESNGNLYFTSSLGIKKISAASASEFSTSSGYITQAGGVKAIDTQGKINVSLGSSGGFLPVDSQIAYRVVWGIKDANQNLVLGTPSERLVLSASLLTILLQDFNRVLGALDDVSHYTSSSLVSDGNYVSTLGLSTTASSVQLQQMLVALAKKLDQDILYADTVSAPLQISGAYINGTSTVVNFSSGTPSNYFTAGSKINLTGFSPLTGTLNGAQTVTNVYSSVSTTGTTTVGQPYQFTLTCNADSSGNLAGLYWLLNSANDVKQYYVWYCVSGAGTDPNIAGRTGIKVNIITNETNSGVASKTSSAITNAVSDFSISVSSATLTVSNNSNGPTTSANAGTTGFSAPTTVQSGTVGNQITSLGTTTGLVVGQRISGTGIPSNSYITSIGLGVITISNNVTSSHTGEAITFDAALSFTPASTASGAVTLSTPTIYSNSYEGITQPAIPSSPATNNQLVALQTYLEEIITQLQAELSTVIVSGAQNAFISPLDVTTTVTTTLTISIPQDVTENHFYQIYRSDIAQATGVQVLSTDVAANDEMKQVYEDFPTSTDLTNGYVTVTDVTPDSFRGAYLYTNEQSGEGILQSNDLPPFALDINKFKNYIFYANTRTRYKQSIDLLGVTNMLTNYNSGKTPKLTVSDGSTTNTYSFVAGVAQVTSIVCGAASTLVQSAAPASYFTINSGKNQDQYYVWYSVGSATDPAISGKTGIKVIVGASDSASTVATRTRDALNRYNADFSATLSTATVTVTNLTAGITTNATAGTSGFTVNTPTAGAGENASSKQILLSSLVSVGEAVDETARSIVHVINSNASEIVYAYYLSGTQDIPGQILLEKRSLDTTPFYVLGDSSVTGQSFNPDISPAFTISSISNTSPTVITYNGTSGSHLSNQDYVVICNSNSSTSVDGLYQVTYISNTQFSININNPGAGTSGVLIPATDAVKATNESLQNRIYYSKYLQPDAVPLVNTIDVGAQDKAILRIFPLRDSLFVFKEDGLYRISGETAPFNLALFDISCILLAPDSLDVSNNYIYAWTKQGIVAVNESSPTVISRDIDVDILKLATSQYSNFSTVTWGMGYESDNSYTVYTIQNTTDTIPQIAYRYSTLTNTWTTFDKSATCGVINPADDKQYLGAGDTNYIEQERKNFDRTDYADREYTQTLGSGNYFGKVVRFPNNFSLFEVGDVLVQTQYLTIYQYNTLLEMLDTDATLTHTYYSTLKSVAGDDLRTKVDNLIDQVANDATRKAQAGYTNASVYQAYKTISTTGTITAISAADPAVITCASHGLQTGRMITITGSNCTPSIDGTWQVTVLTSNTFTIPTSVTQTGSAGTFTVQNENFLDIQTSYNGLIATLNSDAGVSFANYQPVNTTTNQEAAILALNATTKLVTLDNALDFVQGNITHYKGITSEVVWAPQTFGDALSLKHLTEATLMFENRAFTSATLSFASDLIPSFTDIVFYGTGKGLFGFDPFGTNFFGGASNSSPFRTYIPRNVQRCRYLVPKFTHTGAREKYSLFGLSVTGNVSSTRAYR